MATADCVKYIVEEIVPGTDQKDWKRLGKRNEGESVVRQFTNRKTGDAVTVYEKDGVLSVTPEKQNAKAYYAIAKGDPESGHELILYVTDTVCFDRMGHSSGQTPNGTIEALGRLGLRGFELSEGIIEFGLPIPTPEVLAAKMKASPFFAFSKNFQSYCQVFDNSESTVVPIDEPSQPVVPQSKPAVDLSKAIFPKATDSEYQGRYASDFRSRDSEWSGRIVYSIEYDEDDRLFFYCGPECKNGYLEDTLDGGVGEKLKVLFADMDVSVQEAENFHSVGIPAGVDGKAVRKVVEERLVASGAVKMVL